MSTNIYIALFCCAIAILANNYNNFLNQETLVEKYKRQYPRGTPFVVACEKGQLEDVKAFITNLLDKEERYKVEAFHAKKSQKSLKVLKEMVNQVGKESNGWRDKTPLQIAARYEHFQIVKYLIEQGEADPNIADSEYGRNALHYAAYNNKKDTELIELLLTNMSLNSINKKDQMGSTPLEYAYEYNKSPIKQKIIDLIRSKGGKRS